MTDTTMPGTIIFSVATESEIFVSALFFMVEAIVCYVICMSHIIIIMLYNYYYYYSTRSCGTKEPWKAIALNRWIVMEMR